MLWEHKQGDLTQGWSGQAKWERARAPQGGALVLQSGGGAWGSTEQSPEQWRVWGCGEAACEAAGAQDLAGAVSGARTGRAS